MNPRAPPVETSATGSVVPESFTTARLLVRRPTALDAEAVFERYSRDPEVTRYLIWPTHRTVEDTHAFLAWSERAWTEKGSGPYLVFTKEGRLVGGTGLMLETPYRAETGYVFARDAWGVGFATEALAALASLAFGLPALRRLYAVCHVENLASARVLEKAGFVREGLLRSHLVFPNLGVSPLSDVFFYGRLRGE